MGAITLIIGRSPITPPEGRETPAKRRAREHFRALLEEFDLGEVEFADEEGCRDAIAARKPFVVFTFSGSLAEELSRGADFFLYLLERPETAQRMKRQDEERKKFEEAARLIAEIEKDPASEKAARWYAGIGYKEKYWMIKDALVSDKPELVEKAWKTLNMGHGDWPWIRVNLLVDIWKECDAEGRERYVTIPMERRVKEGTAERIEDVTDNEGVRYKRYRIKNPEAMEGLEVYRIPVATKDMTKERYEDLLKCANRRPKESEKE